MVASSFLFLIALARCNGRCKRIPRHDPDVAGCRPDGRTLNLGISRGLERNQAVVYNGCGALIRPHESLKSQLDKAAIFLAETDRMIRIGYGEGHDGLLIGTVAGHRKIGLVSDDHARQRCGRLAGEKLIHVFRDGRQCTERRRDMLQSAEAGSGTVPLMIAWSLMTAPAIPCEALANSA